jgi:hypothetical protein
MTDNLAAGSTARMMAQMAELGIRLQHGEERAEPGRTLVATVEDDRLRSPDSGRVLTGASLLNRQTSLKAAVHAAGGWKNFCELNGWDETLRCVRLLKAEGDPWVRAQVEHREREARRLADQQARFEQMYAADAAHQLTEAELRNLPDAALAQRQAEIEAAYIERDQRRAAPKPAAELRLSGQGEVIDPLLGRLASEPAARTVPGGGLEPARRKPVAGAPARFMDPNIRLAPGEQVHGATQEWWDEQHARDPQIEPRTAPAATHEAVRPAPQPMPAGAPVASPYAVREAEPATFPLPVTGGRRVPLECRHEGHGRFCTACGAPR